MRRTQPAAHRLNPIKAATAAARAAPSGGCQQGYRRAARHCARRTAANGGTPLPDPGHPTAMARYLFALLLILAATHALVSPESPGACAQPPQAANMATEQSYIMIKPGERSGRGPCTACAAACGPGGNRPPTRRGALDRPRIAPGAGLITLPTTAPRDTPCCRPQTASSGVSSARSSSASSSAATRCAPSR